MDAADITRVVAELKQDGSLSDQRFADSFIYNRIQRGYGPLRIRQELRERGVDGEIISNALDENDNEWLSRLIEVRNKKFGGSIPADYSERMRQSRFLQYRGFTGEQISRLFKRD